MVLKAIMWRALVPWLIITHISSRQKFNFNCTCVIQRGHVHHGFLCFINHCRFSSKRNKIMKISLFFSFPGVNRWFMNKFIYFFYKMTCGWLQIELDIEGFSMLYNVLLHLSAPWFYPQSLSLEVELRIRYSVQGGLFKIDVVDLMFYSF